MGMILLRRRFNYASRPRPNALAIVDPATNKVLYPGIAKIEKSPEKEFAVGNGDAKVSNVFQSHEQQQPQQQQQIFVDFPADRKLSYPKLATYFTLHYLSRAYHRSRLPVPNVHDGQLRSQQQRSNIVPTSHQVPWFALYERRPQPVTRRFRLQPMRPTRWNQDCNMSSNL